MKDGRTDRIVDVIFQADEGCRTVLDRDIVIITAAQTEDEDYYDADNLSSSSTSVMLPVRVTVHAMAAC